MFLKLSLLFNKFRWSLSSKNFQKRQNWSQIYPWQTTLVVASISVLVTGGIGWAKQQGKLQFLALLTYDFLVQIQPQKPIDSRLLIVGITEEDIQNQKRWPLMNHSGLRQVIQICIEYCFHRSF